MSSVNLQSALLSGPRTARELASALNVSQPTVSRWLAEQRDQILVIGKARATRYALRRAVREIGSEWPVYRVDEVGGVSLAGRLYAFYPAGYLWRDALNHQESVFEGLPWFLADNRPQGFLGRQLVGLHQVEGLPERLDAWGDDDILYGLTRMGFDLPGNLLVGDLAVSGFQRQTGFMQNLAGDLTLVSRAKLRGLYPALIQRSWCFDRLKSSAGGEQPKLPQCEYLRCEKGGDLVGQSACQSVYFGTLREAARTRKETCDTAFEKDIVDLNPNRPQCSFFSWLYPNTVRLLGNSSFVGIDPASSSTLSQEEQEKSLDAINAFFKEWSAAQIKTFEEQVRKGAIKLDFERPLRFDKQRGLFNL